MVLLANQLAGRMRALIAIESKIVDAKHKHEKEQAILELDKKRSAMIRSFTRDELIVIKTVMNIGRSERGYRFFANSERSDYYEIIRLPIELNERELMEKYSYYLVHKTERELADAIEYYTAVSEQLKEGMAILKL
ncbi:hypothetical protein GCM10008014_54800 [Paenibacillus silvae]|uniref:Uncharacterized protein n=2 Tax=Paenibacillus silvae TaxID=1325358 RepID=A0ABQ1ZPQ0_9BACL|nr:hypothetical protein [Paenibacillus silvae]GGH70400.1 hypothetical protein GCM10008014_54800 [Paenibacillus silvae]